MVAAYNIAFWFGGSGSGAQQPSRPGCGPPNIFLFSKQPLEGRVVVLCHVAAVIVAVFVFPATLLLLLLTVRLCGYACLFLYRDLVYLCGQATPQTVQSLQSAGARINALLEKQGIPFQHMFWHESLPVGLFGSFMDVLGFLATPKGKAIRFSDVIKVCVSLGTGKVTAKDAESGRPVQGGGLMSGWKGAECVMPLNCLHFLRMHI
jgi:hypothetical protein